MAFQPSNAVYQGAESKIRAIDDGKRSALNLAYTTNFKLELYDVDTLAALVASVADNLQFGKVSFDMEDNTTYTVPVHPDGAAGLQAASGGQGLKAVECCGLLS